MIMKEIIVIGAGGHAAEIDEYILYNQNSGISDYTVIGFLDDNPLSYKKYRFSAPFLGNIKTHCVRKDVFYVIAIANIEFRKPIVNLFLKEQASFCTIVHYTSYVSPSAKIGIGVVLAPYANVGPNAVIGDFTLVNARASIGHDSIIGLNNFVSPNVSFSGNTVVGDDNLFGINSATIPGIQIGSRNKVAAGMIVDKNIEDDCVVFHRFKEKVIAILKS
jgi:sugar O-acyltransferase (sialic acid O-acetyltransferase NeuD family)